jgi:nucleoside-diphosphate-sugar epimerase
MSCGAGVHGRCDASRDTVLRETILITGAVGRVAGMTSPTLRSAFRLRRLDLRTATAEDDDEVITGDVRDLALVEDACARVLAVVHLAAQPAEADFRARLLPRNIDATWAVFEAAARAKVPRFVFASSIQTIGAYPSTEHVPANASPRPESVYGCTKLFGEALGRFHADRSGLGVACLRAGAVRVAGDPSLTDEQTRNNWCSAADLARLIIAAIGSTVPFAIVTAVSPPASNRFDTVNPFGWTPVDQPSGPV